MPNYTISILWSKEAPIREEGRNTWPRGLGRTLFKGEKVGLGEGDSSISRF